MKRARASWTILPIIVALALAASACRGGGAPRPKDTGPPPATRNDINRVDRDALPDGGTLRWALVQIPPNFNLNHTDGPLGDNAAVMGALLLSPFDFDAAAQPVLRQELVESAELTSTDPNQVVIYRINPKAIWYDGTPITEADFEAQWRALNGRDPRFKVASTQGYDKIESVAKGRDEREVVVTFKEKYADWQGLFGLYPASTNRNPKVFNEGWKEKPITTAGPFKLEGINLTDKTITLVRNEKWWGRPPKLERIIYRAIDADAHIDALANGEIDFIDVGPNVDNFRRAQKTRGVVLRKAGGPQFRHFTINSTSEVLKDVRVRRALALGIDRARIAKALIGPLGVPAVPLNNHIYMTNQKGYQDNAGDLSRYDPKKAGEMLDEAGWKLAGGFRAKGGKRLTIRFVIPSQVAQARQESELAQAMLKKIGVEVNIETVPSGDFFDKNINPGNFDFTTFTWGGTVFPISSSKSIYAKPKAGPGGELDIQQNYARVGSDELDRIFDKATAEFGQDRAIELGNQIDAMIWEEVHSLTLYQRPEIVATNAKLANFGAFGFATLIYEDVGFAAPSAP
ncbi:MAG: ABC transporter family substrate-binding protein [Actinomycetota bacterium]